MYLHLGQSTVIDDKDIIGIFDLDITSQSFRTRQFLNRAEQAGQVTSVSDELPKSFVLCQRTGEKEQRVYLAQPTSGTLLKRIKNGVSF
ncbi:MAG: DUF370 domain-containing protein [Clostridiales bacterium]|nr:DUF370 domain-containing protein [Clostridiales bacterium]